VVKIQLKNLHVSLKLFNPFKITFDEKKIHEQKRNQLSYDVDIPKKIILHHNYTYSI